MTECSLCKRTVPTGSQHHPACFQAAVDPDRAATLAASRQKARDRREARARAKESVLLARAAHEQYWARLEAKLDVRDARSQAVTVMPTGPVLTDTFAEAMGGRQFEDARVR